LNKQPAGICCANTQQPLQKRSKPDYSQPLYH